MCFRIIFKSPRALLSDYSALLLYNFQLQSVTVYLLLKAFRGKEGLRFCNKSQSKAPSFKLKKIKSLVRKKMFLKVCGMTSSTEK